LAVPDPTIETKPKRLRRWAKRPANPNDEFPNASLSVLDVRLILHELRSYEKRIANHPGRDFSRDRKHVRGLIEKLHQVRWSPEGETFSQAFIRKAP
jgi:hypothetical protein